MSVELKLLCWSDVKRTARIRLLNLQFDVHIHQRREGKKASLPVISVASYGRHYKQEELQAIHDALDQAYDIAEDWRVGKHPWKSIEPVSTVIGEYTYNLESLEK